MLSVLSRSFFLVPIWGVACVWVCWYDCHQLAWQSRKLMSSRRMTFFVHSEPLQNSSLVIGRAQFFDRLRTAGRA